MFHNLALNKLPAPAYISLAIKEKINKDTEIIHIDPEYRKKKNYQTVGNNVYPTQKYQKSSNENLSPNKLETQKIILLTDETGKGMNALLRKKVNTSNIQSVVKPNAPLSVVMGDIVKIAEPLSKRDFIIILAGKNDFDRKRFPSFKLICNMLKKCNTNIIFASTPYTNNHNTNKRIFNFNYRLNEFLIKLNKINEGSVQYCEINLNSNKKSKSDIATMLACSVMKKKCGI